MQKKYLANTTIAKADICAVFILTDPKTHRRFAVAAAEAVKHFLSQKPVATTIDDLESITKAVSLSNRYILRNYRMSDGNQFRKMSA